MTTRLNDEAHHHHFLQSSRRPRSLEESPVGVSASPFEPMLIDAQSILLAAAAPGAVVAPKWLLPTAAACVAAIPATMIPIVKGMEREKVNWETLAPAPHEGFAAANANAFCVLDAGAKGAGLFATCDVKKGTYLFDYTGDLLDQTEYDVRYPNRVSDYCAALRSFDGSMRFIDGRDEIRGSPGRWMNHDEKRPNVGRRTFHPSNDVEPRILMYALTDLRAGDELQWDYGPGFWAAHGGKIDSD